MTTEPAYASVPLALIAIVCGAMGFVLAVAAVPAQTTVVAADGLVFLRDSALAWLTLWTSVGAFRNTAFIARIVGIVMVLLGAGVLTVAFARLVAGSHPEPKSMIAFGALAVGAQLIAGVLALRARRLAFSPVSLWRVASDGLLVHLLVIVSAIAVVLTRSNLADIAVGAAMAAFFAVNGALTVVRGRLPGPLEG